MTGFGAGSGISWTICKHSAPRSRQITTPTPHHLIFIGWMLFIMPCQHCQNNEGQQVRKVRKKGSKYGRKTKQASKRQHMNWGTLQPVAKRHMFNKKIMTVS